MTREVDLIQYLPAIMKSYKEMKEITTTENPEFNLLWSADELIKKNLYIVTAEEEGLRRYERMLGIPSDTTSSDEARRTRLIARWNDLAPYTLKYLIGLLTVLTNGQFELITNFPAYEMQIIVSLTTSGAVAELSRIIKQIIPCNLLVDSDNKLDAKTEGKLYMAGVVVKTLTYHMVSE